MRPWHWTRPKVQAMGRWVAANVVGVVFTMALVMASVGFGLAWLPLGFIAPGSLIVCLMIAWKWRMTLPPKQKED